MNLVFLFCLYRYDHVKPNISKKTAASDSFSKFKSPRVCAPPVLKELFTPSNDMVSLKKVLKGEPTSSNLPKSPEEWVQASEFVPGQPYKCLSSK